MEHVDRIVWPDLKDEESMSYSDPAQGFRHLAFEGKASPARVQRPAPPVVRKKMERPWNVLLCGGSPREFTDILDLPVLNNIAKTQRPGMAVQVMPSPVQLQRWLFVQQPGPTQVVLVVQEWAAEKCVDAMMRRPGFVQTVVVVRSSGPRPANPLNLEDEYGRKKIRSPVILVDEAAEVGKAIEGAIAAEKEAQERQEKAWRALEEETEERARQRFERKQQRLHAHEKKKSTIISL